MQTDITEHLDSLRTAYDALTTIRKRDGWRGYEAAIQWLFSKVEEDEMRECAEAEDDRQRAVEAAE